MSDYHWTQITDEAAFAPRDGAGALSFQKQMWLLGGWNPSDKKFFPHVCNSEVWSTPDGKTWALQTHADWEGRHTAGYAVHDDKMWIVGGDPIQGHYQNDVWHSSDGTHWQQATASVPWGPRALHYTVAFENKLRNSRPKPKRFTTTSGTAPTAKTGSASSNTRRGRRAA
jgi:hypothetical protein